jgi:hypothetical protein
MCAELLFLSVKKRKEEEEGKEEAVLFEGAFV